MLLLIAHYYQVIRHYNKNKLSTFWYYVQILRIFLIYLLLLIRHFYKKMSQNVHTKWHGQYRKFQDQSSNVFNQSSFLNVELSTVNLFSGVKIKREINFGNIQV